MNRQFIQGLSIDWSKIDSHSYLREIEAINQLEEVVFEKPITFFVGENGSGKSTLLEALAVSYGFNPEGGTKKYSFSTYDSHFPILLGIPDAQILSFDSGAVHECAYEDTESYKVTEMFINNRHILLNKLLSE